MPNDPRSVDAKTLKKAGSSEEGEKSNSKTFDARWWARSGTVPGSQRAKILHFSKTKQPAVFFGTHLDMRWLAIRRSVVAPSPPPAARGFPREGDSQAAPLSRCWQGGCGGPQSRVCREYTLRRRCAGAGLRGAGGCCV